MILSAIQIPFSQSIVKTELNHISGMERISPADHQSIPLKTDCWFWHDGRYLFAHWEMDINDGFYPGAYATRDDSQNSDYVRIQLKTLKNEDFAYYFSVYPYGNCYDGIRKENFQVDNAWDSFFDCESEFTDNNWQVTMKIPFKDLRFEGQPPYEWGISLARQVFSEDAAYGNPFLSTSGSSTRQYFDSFEKVVITDPIDTPVNYQIIPYLYSSYDLENEEYSDLGDHIGLNISYRPTDNTSAKAAFNPDFTETPVDEERDIHNNKYPPSYNENRLFFTEDLNAFGVGDGLFYTRNIMQPVYAFKYTATGQDWNFAVMSAKDKETKENGEIINADDNFNVIAFKKTIGNLSDHSTFLARTNPQRDYYNYVFQTYPFLQINPTMSMDARFVLTCNQENHSEKEYGHRLSLGLNKRINNFSSALYCSYLSKDYKPGMASWESQMNTNLVNAGWNLNYENYMNHSFIRTYSIYQNLNIDCEREDIKTIRNRYANIGMNLNFVNQTGISLNINAGSDRLQTGLTDWYEADCNYSWSCFLPLNGYIGTTVGNNISYMLSDVFLKKVFYGGFNGYLGPAVSYNVRNSHVIWKEFPADIPIDNEYDISNLDMELTFNSRFKIVSGVRYNNYNTVSDHPHLGYFSTVYYYITPASSLYVGYKSTEDEMNDSFERTSASLWTKINIVF